MPYLERGRRPPDRPGCPVSALVLIAAIGAPVLILAGIVYGLFAH